ncbi:TlpA family protein disulfide reductase [Pedosphaera parvula]|uniref:Thioredoxin domain-containing protein n=1 Tax=Pedosphaera parvula (strain Ellin514) TaxID=320771 RepID=B9XMY4_PEDPL|nr:hypothetical protein [Pedosphaera parvula]EEF58780.1 hypothetical protein Cflav_PD1953 [Pedosphaera parvula Ellin514]
MKKIALLLAALSFATLSQAALKPGDSLSPYTIHNVSSGKEYCQVCAYGTKSGKIVSFGKLGDEAFWSDLKKLQTIADNNPKLGVFAQVIDSKDSKAIQAAAEKHGIKFPVVVAVEKDWDKAYDVKGVSRTIYYARQKNNIVWTSTGLDDKAASQLESQVTKDLSS